MKLLKYFLAPLLALLGFSFFGNATAQQQFISIGTGGVTGVYYPTGGAICRLVNKDRKDHGIRCSAESTGGSVYNINTLRGGELEFGVAQSDWQYHAYYGTSKFEEQGPMNNLRAVFAVHPEPFMLLARSGSGISKFEDLVDRKVNVSNPGSGQRATMEVVMDAFGITMDDFAVASELKSAELAQALCDGKVEAGIMTVGNPAAVITEMVTTCDIDIIDVEGPEITSLIAENSFYRTATVPGGMYAGNDDDISTFGVGATLVSSSDVPEEVVYTLVKAVFENFEDFKGLHPAFNNLTEEEMISGGLAAPLHDGAKKYYQERGWM